MARSQLIQVRRDTAANWASVNPVLAAGEIGYETDTKKKKIGNGTLAWNSLGYDTAFQFIADAVVDLDDYKYSGSYFFSSNGTTISNIPAGNNGFLVVYANNDSTNSDFRVKQVWYRSGTNNTSDWQQYTRTQQGGVWSSWRRVVMDVDSTIASIFTFTQSPIVPTPTTSTQAANKTYVDTADALKENLANKSTSTTLGTSDTLYPSQNAVKTYVDTADALNVLKSGSTMTGPLTLNGDPTSSLYATPKRYVDQHTVLTVSRNTGSDYPAFSYASDDLAVQAAVNALGTNGGTVLIKSGTYAFAGQVSCPNPKVRIVGEGSSTVISWKAAGTYTGLFLFQLKGYSQISDLQIDGNRTNVTGGGGIYLYQSARVWLNKLYIANCAEDAILAVGTASNASSHANKFTDIYILNCGGYGYWGKSYTYDCQFLNFWVGTSNVGMRLESGSNFLTNVHLWGNTGNGLELRSANNHITNGYYESNGGKGIDIFNTSYNLIESSDIWNNGTAGISVASAKNTNIQGCLVRENVGPGISLSGTTTATIITTNQFYDTLATKVQTYAVSSSGTADSNIICNNIMNRADLATGPLNLSGGTKDVVYNNVGVNGENPYSYGSLDGSSTVFIDHRNGHYITATLTGNWGTVSFITTHAVKGEQVTLALTQDATGGRTITWPSNVKLAGGSLTLSTAANATDIITFVYDGTNWREVSRALQSTVAGGSATWGSITGTLTDQTDLSAALSGKEPSVTAGTTSQYYRGDKSWQTLNKAAVGLSNVDNTSDANKPVSTAQQAALDLKQNKTDAWIIQSSGLASSVTGTTSETVLKTITIPGGAIGPNGVIRLTLNFSHTNNANVKNLIARLGGVSGTLYANISAANQVRTHVVVHIYARNSQTSQIGGSNAGNSSGVGQSTTSQVTSTKDMSVNQDIVIAGTLATSTDSITLESYLLEYHYQA